MKRFSVKIYTLILTTIIIAAIGFAYIHEKKVSVQIKIMPQEATLFEIKIMPKQEFLNTVARAKQLDNDEKQLIQRSVDPNGYTHCRLVKYKKNCELFLELDQFYPLEERGQDAAGHKIMEGGSGSLIRFKKQDEEWIAFMSTEYD